jgi:hypothetical protein
MWHGDHESDEPSSLVSLARGLAGLELDSCTLGVRAPAQDGVSTRFGSLRAALEDAPPMAYGWGDSLEQVPPHYVRVLSVLFPTDV